MAHLLTFINNGGIWKGTIRPRLHLLLILLLIVPVTKVFQKGIIPGYNVQSGE